MLFVLIKIYPVFGLSLGVLMIDLAKTLRRRANPMWMALIFFAVLFFVSTLVWLVFRGDKNADRWFYEFQLWLQN